jgi:hypothetical protein
MGTDKTSVKVLGADRVARTSRKAADDLGDLRGGQAAIAAAVVPVARALAPKVSGALAGTIRGLTAKGVTLIEAGSVTVRYAGVINYGWPSRGIKPSLFLQRAGQGTEAGWTAAYRNEVQHTLDKVKGV